MDINKFEEKWNDCSVEDKLAMFREFCNQTCCDDEIYEFDEEFFDMFFTNKMDLVMAICHGNIQSCSDEYIKFDGYGNLESLTKYDAEEVADMYWKQIYKYERIWSDYIEDDDDDWDDEDEQEDE